MRFFYCCTLLLLIAFVYLFFALAQSDSLTVPERATLPAGVAYATEHSAYLAASAPPLVPFVSGLGVSLFDRIIAPQEHTPEKLITAARSTMLIFAFLAVGMLYVIGRTLGSAVVGLTAVMLYLLDPNTLGHAHIVIMAIPAGATTLLALYSFARLLSRPSSGTAVFAGASLGVALLTSFSALVLVVLFLFYTLIVAALRLGSAADTHTPWSTCSAYAINYFVTVIAIFWGGYALMTFNTPPTAITAAITTHAHTAPLWLTDTADTINTSIATRPLAVASVHVLEALRAHASRAGVYFLGAYPQSTALTYFPTLLLLKQTFVHLFCYVVAFSVALPLWSRALQRTSHVWHASLYALSTTHALPTILLLYVLSYTVLALSGFLLPGMHSILPLLGVLYVLVAFALSQLTIQPRTYAIASIVLLATLLVEHARIAPYHLSYFNDIVDGPQYGYRYVAGTNADWGQDLYRLRDYLSMHPEITMLHFDYATGSDPLHILDAVEVIPWWSAKRPIAPGYYALSVDQLQTSLFDKTASDAASYQWLLAYEPFEIVGTSILLFHVPQR